MVRAANSLLKKYGIKYKIRSRKAGNYNNTQLNYELYDPNHVSKALYYERTIEDIMCSDFIRRSLFNRPMTREDCDTWYKYCDEVSMIKVKRENDIINKKLRNANSLLKKYNLPFKEKYDGLYKLFRVNPDKSESLVCRNIHPHVSFIAVINDYDNGFRNISESEYIKFRQILQELNIEFE